MAECRPEWGRTLSRHRTGRRRPQWRTDPQAVRVAESLIERSGFGGGRYPETYAQWWPPGSGHVRVERAHRAPGGRQQAGYNPAHRCRRWRRSPAPATTTFGLARGPKPASRTMTKPARPAGQACRTIGSTSRRRATPALPACLCPPMSVGLYPPHRRRRAPARRRRLAGAVKNENRTGIGNRSPQIGNLNSCHSPWNSP